MNSRIYRCKCGREAQKSITGTPAYVKWRIDCDCGKTSGMHQNSNEAEQAWTNSGGRIEEGK